MTQPKFNSTTTLNEIRAAGPCKAGWEELLKHLGKTAADDEPLSILTILESNGFDDAAWCLRVPSLERLSRHFQAWCAEQVLRIFESACPGDMRVRDQIAMLKNDSATSDDRAAAWVAARDAAWVAARDVAWAAARDAAWVAAEAAWVAARDAARDAARGAAWAAARDAQERQLRAMIEMKE